MEYWDIYDDKGKTTGRINAEKGSLAPGEHHLAIEAWLWHPEGYFLIQKRSMSRSTFAGRWAHTTGRVQAGEDSLRGCLREIKEELGISLSEEEPLLVKRVMKTGTPLIWDIFVVKRAIQVSELVLDSTEVDSVRFVTPVELLTIMQSGRFVDYPEIREIYDAVMEQLMMQN